MMHRERDGHMVVERVLKSFISECKSGAEGRRTIVTSSPTTEWSGLRKCRRAAIAANEAQSKRLPSSLRKCTSTRIDQTCAQEVSGDQRR